MGMGREELVSVVVPSFNRGYCLAATVDSALGQTYANIEVIVVDDGSTDDTEAVVARAYGHEPRVRYLRQPNGGVSAARNHGLREARGAYVALLDSDDLWLPWKIEAQVRCLEAFPHAGMVWTDMDAVNDDGELVAPRYLTKMYDAYRWFASREDLFETQLPFAAIDARLAAEIGEPDVHAGDIFSEMVLGNLVHTSTVLLRRERFERVREFDVRLERSGEDYDFHLRTCREGPVAYLDAAAVRYRHGCEDQLTFEPAFRIDMARNFLATITPVIARDRDRIRLPPLMIDEVLAEAHAWVGECHHDRGEHRAAIRALASSLRHKPAQPRIAALLALSLLPPPAAQGAHRIVRKAKKLAQGLRTGQWSTT